jgi:hypothetical protein
MWMQYRTKNIKDYRDNSKGTWSLENPRMGELVLELRQQNRFLFLTQTRSQLPVYSGVMCFWIFTYICTWTLTWTCINMNMIKWQELYDLDVTQRRTLTGRNSWQYSTHLGAFRGCRHIALLYVLFNILWMTPYYGCTVHSYLFFSMQLTA